MIEALDLTCDEALGALVFLSIAVCVSLALTLVADLFKGDE